MARLHSLAPAVALALAALVASCHRPDSQALVVEAGNPRQLASWRESISNEFKPAEWREFEGALQDIRLGIMAEREASGSAAVEDAMCARINGRTFREALVLSYTARLARLDPTRTQLKSAIDGNAQLITKPGDTKSAQYLDGYRGRQAERLRKIESEIAQAEDRLAELSPKEWSPRVKERRQTARTEMSSLAVERTLTEINRFFEDQRAALMQRFDRSPATVVTDEADLPEPQRSDFRARRGAENGHEVIAVFLDDRWWIYDDKPELPTFIRSMATKLPEEHLKNVTATWASLQAELWARRSAAEQTRN